MKLCPNDERLPAATSPDWQPRMFGIAVSVIGAWLLVSGVIYGYGVAVDCLRVGETSLTSDSSVLGVLADSTRNWGRMVQPVVTLIIGGYFLTGASALVNLLYPTSEVGDDRA